MRTTKTAPVKAAPARPGLPALVAALGFVVVSRLLLYISLPDRSSDFDFLYQAAARLLQGENPYPSATQWFPYPLPAVLLAVPFTAIPLSLARPIFDVLVGAAFVYALWKYRGVYSTLAVASGAYLLAMWHGQTTPLMVAAALVPALGFLLAVRPNTSAALWIARPSLRSLLAASLVLALSLLVRPSWPWDWWLALPPDHTALMPPLLRPFGFLLLAAALRWRLPEGRFLLAIGFIPQTTLPYELVPLALIPANRREMGLYVVGTWIAVAAGAGLHLSESMPRWTATGWPVTLGAVYLPMLYLVLRRKIGKSQPRTGKERRRPHRLPDAELKVDITTDGSGGVIAKVTHIPSRMSATESGRTREAAERKAHDKLAGMLRPTEKG
ncbi:MAG TPA: hypothetical protein VFH26_00315 [Gemmatimonadales bacterium]|nr:hypothetical protein [Gemmatimonadales bacterium]